MANKIDNKELKSKIEVVSKGHAKDVKKEQRRRNGVKMFLAGVALTAAAGGINSLSNASTFDNNSKSGIESSVDNSEATGLSYEAALKDIDAQITGYDELLEQIDKISGLDVESKQHFVTPDTQFVNNIFDYDELLDSMADQVEDLKEDAIELKEIMDNQVKEKGAESSISYEEQEAYEAVINEGADEMAVKVELSEKEGEENAEYCVAYAMSDAAGQKEYKALPKNQRVTREMVAHTFRGENGEDMNFYIVFDDMSEMQEVVGQIATQGDISNVSLRALAVENEGHDEELGRVGDDARHSTTSQGLILVGQEKRVLEKSIAPAKQSKKQAAAETPAPSIVAPAPSVAPAPAPSHGPSSPSPSSHEEHEEEKEEHTVKVTQAKPAVVPSINQQDAEEAAPITVDETSEPQRESFNATEQIFGVTLDESREESFGDSIGEPHEEVFGDVDSLIGEIFGDESIDLNEETFDNIAASYVEHEEFEDEAENSEAQEEEFGD